MRSFLRIVQSAARLLLAPMLVALFAFSALAGEAEDKAAVDTLFAQLRVAHDAEAARAIDQRIWSYWTTPSDPVLAGRMREVLAARNKGNVMAAIRLLDKLVEDYPGYAEGWNQRATMYYAIGNYEASIADCGKVLELEPRHFGALSGRALMYLQLGKRALALKDMAAALAVHPFLTERELFPELAHGVTHV